MSFFLFMKSVYVVKVVQSRLQALCNKITGMLLDLQPHQLITIVASEDLLRSHVEEAADMLMAAGLGNNSRPSDAPSSSGGGEQCEPTSADSAIAKAASTPNLQGIHG